jgi:hypothetical protein
LTPTIQVSQSLSIENGCWTEHYGLLEGEYHPSYWRQREHHFTRQGVHAIPHLLWRWWDLSDYTRLPVASNSHHEASEHGGRRAEEAK